MRTFAIAVAATLALPILSAEAATEITWWHAMEADLGQKVDKIADDFNKSQSEYHLTAVFKGSYADTMNAAVAAFRAHQQPDIVQVFEVGTGSMMAAKGAIVPIYELMKDQGEPFDPKAYLSAVTGYYTDPQGDMLSFPFNSSTPILYYNKDMFQKAGLDEAPKTWEDMAAFSRKLQASGVTCGFTTEWPSWTQVENFSAWHNIPLSTRANGFEGFDAELEIDNPLEVRHIADLAEWQKTKIFDYGGREGKARPKFLSGECAMIIASSASRSGILANAKFAVGFGMMPYYADVKGAPQNSIIGGASLWVLTGRPAAEYKGVAKFFAYLARPEVQAWWHEQTGYLPITTAAYELAKKQGFYDENPGAEISILQMNLNPPTENSKGLRFGNFVQIRAIIEEEMENAFSGKKDAKTAMHDAVMRGDALLRRFEDANK